MAHEHAGHRQYEGDFYAETQQKLQQNVHRFGVEDQGEAREGVTPQTQNQAAQYSVEQGKILLNNQATRGDAPAPGQNYAASSHEELYGMVHENMNPGELDDRGRVANKLGNWLADVSNAANDAVNSSEIQWQGDGAAKAHGFFQNTATYTAETANAAQLSSNRYSQQAAAADYAQKNMPEPTGFNQEAEITKATKQYQAGDVVGATQTMNNVAAKQQQADAAHQQAVQVLQNLDSTYHETASTQPTYTPPPQLGQGDSTSASGFHGTGGSGFTGAPTIGGTGPGGTSGSFVPGQVPGQSPGTGPGQLPGPTPPGTTPPAYIPPGTSSGTSSGTGGGTNSGTSNFRTAPAAGTFGRFTPDGLAVPGTTAAGGGTGAGSDSTRSKGRPGTGFAGSRVSGSAGVTPKETEGGKTGSKPGERLERGATAAAAAKGKAGEAGAAGAGAGKKKEEDKEHKNKYAVEEDVFDLKPERGPDGEKIVKPTIGETT
ncbi:hypothetical protein SAMN04489727_9044 [Amycolatopsis tolypomycina]|uniref:PPE family protein n=1 Tax=Amycolatopsis tolypomycina TaxID=208445 RepID=A0A1H5CYE3_9PSEU|nr:hypothetical protein [Amycolatopsis tolypomycina]SED71524.1 hypothetical protein SAMN04489727_9044 [Amycolatopsis tolypomycina]